MRAWAYMLGGLIVWTVHFFAIYIAASVFPGLPLGHVLTLLITLACLAADAWLIVRLRVPSGGDDFREWMRKLALVGAGISAISVLWQGLPALIV
ncbi:hypothetical protein [Sphingomonas jeddahensis]|uniref:Uncharacterized protein n=1 Tax=Sphingomonas jeddahensis TaxID=1915074 RepID=A0A1V2EU35_9SPHN|nr:hypothetical protein [Sphingomonas jeddahensis]ONF95689.1 hypothetical protein SPHI_21260 [Sphingomonas jeddahensis]